MTRVGWHLARMATIALLGTVSLLTACGGGGSSSSAPVPTPTPGPGPVGNGSSTPAIVNFGDAPSDRVVAFELTINSVSLTRSDNSTVTLLSSPSRVEVTHVSGSAEPLAIPSVPQGTYTAASVVVSAPDVVYIDNSGRPVEKKISLTKTISIPLSPAITVGATPVVLTVDVDARSSISIDIVSGNVTINPVATLRMGTVAAAQNQDVESGELEHVLGEVTAASANQFTIVACDGTVSLTFVTNSATNFEGVTGASSLALNSVIRVEANTQQDGSLLATEVEAISQAGSEAEGLVTTTTGNPVSKLGIVIQDGNGSGVTTSSLGMTLAVNIDSSTSFRVEDGNIDLGGLSIPAFSAASLSKGQRVEVESDNAPANGELSAEGVKLQQQALVGSVSAINQNQFTLTVPDDSAFHLLTGKTTLRVSTQRNTKLVNGVSVTQGALIKVRGLVFFDPAQGAYTMVAGRIANP